MSTAVQTKTAQELASELYNLDIYNKQLVKENFELKRQIGVMQRTLRDKFAEQAMQSQKWVFYVGAQITADSLNGDARRCYKIADAMLKERVVA